MGRDEWIVEIALSGGEPEETLEAMRVYRTLARPDGETVKRESGDELQHTWDRASLEAEHPDDNGRNI